MSQPEKKAATLSPETAERLNTPYRPLRLEPSPNADPRLVKSVKALNLALTLFDLYKENSTRWTIEPMIAFRDLSDGSKVPDEQKTVDNLTGQVSSLLEAADLIGKILINQQLRLLPSTPTRDSVDSILAFLAPEKKAEISSVLEYEELVRQSINGSQTGKESLTDNDTAELEQLKKDLVLNAQMDSYTERAEAVKGETAGSPYLPQPKLEDKQAVNSEDDLVIVMEKIEETNHDAKQKLTAAKGHIQLYSRHRDFSRLEPILASLADYDQIIDVQSTKLWGEIPKENLRLASFMTTIDTTISDYLEGIAELDKFDLSLFDSLGRNESRVYFSLPWLKVLTGNIVSNTEKSFRAEPTENRSFGVFYEVTDKNFIIRFEQIGGKKMLERIIEKGYSRGDTEWDREGVLPGQGIGMANQVRTLKEQFDGKLNLGYITDPNDSSKVIGLMHEIILPLVKPQEQS